ncbi:MAG: metallophosphoesterase family protein [Gammaproteobacteria bacterium]
MKIAVLSDVHGNVPALEAVLADLEQWRADEVIVNGDLVSRGPYSLQVLDMMRERVPDCRFLTGNHETFVLYCADHPADPERRDFDLKRFAYWACDRLGSEAVEEIRGWADHVDLADLDGGCSFHVTHGSRLGNRDGIHPGVDDGALAEKLGAPRGLFVGSHTHKPLLRRFNGTLVANTGSVGQPFDHDPRAAYGRFTFRAGRWQAQIARVAYDKAQAERDFHDSGFLDQGGPLVKLILLELQQSRMHVGRWMAHYLPPVKAGEIRVADGVQDYLRRL